MDFLSAIHAAFTAPASSQDQDANPGHGTEDASLEDAKRRRILHALLDLISLEGIYPSLSSGVGIPLQQRVISVLPAGVIAKQSDLYPSDKPHNEALLDRILSGLSAILLDPRPSIQPVIRGRILTDIISGALDLSINSNSTSTERKCFYQTFIDDLIKEYVLSVDP